MFVADPDAPIAAVAKHAGVNISSLYRRFASKEELIRRLCGDGLHSYIEIAQAAIDDEEGDPWEVFCHVHATDHGGRQPRPHGAAGRALHTQRAERT